MPKLTQQELNQRRLRIVAAVLAGVPRADIPDRVGETRKTVGRDIAAVRKILGGRGGTNRSALEETLEALNTAGRLETVDNARVATLRAMADQLDVDTTNSQMFRVYWDALEALTTDGNDDGPLGELLEELFSNPGDATASGAGDVRS
jgi:hypothetical protein